MYLKMDCICSQKRVAYSMTCCDQGVVRQVTIKKLQNLNISKRNCWIVTGNKYLIHLHPWFGICQGVRLKCYYAFFLVCCGCDTSYIVSVHIQCQASIYTLSLCRGHSWRVQLAEQETLTPPGHLVSPLVCRGPWMSTVVLYCWCHSDSASVHLYFTFVSCFK